MGVSTEAWLSIWGEAGRGQRDKARGWGGGMGGEGRGLGKIRLQGDLL